MNRPDKAYSVIRDPVHGDLYLTAEEMRLLDTREMQRLRGVRQLGTAYLVYPGAQHTRFEHSLGTLHLTQRLIEAINLNRALAPRELLGVSDEEARVLRAAALVHDITHLPFGHNIEDQSGLLERHDSPERFLGVLAADTEVGRQLERMGIRTEVLAVLCPAGTPGLPAVPPCWRELLSDTICADILDYLRRDAWGTGLNLLYDDRVLNYFKIDRHSGHLFVDVAKRGVVREDILSELVRVLEARYFFSERVYYHHAKVAAGAMVATLVDGSLHEGGLLAHALHDQTDDSLFPLLAAHPPAAPQAAARHTALLERYRSRRLLKRACVFPRYDNQDVQASLLERFFAPEGRPERAHLEAAVRDSLGAAGAAVPAIVLYCPARRMQLKEAGTHVRFPGQDEVRPLSDFHQRVPRLPDLERSYRDLWKMYVFAATDDPELLWRIAGQVAELLPEAANAYHPKSR